LYAAQYAGLVSGIVVVAPHIFVEDMTWRDPPRATAYLERACGQLAPSRDVDSAFWLERRLADPAFRSWNIEDAYQA